MEEEMGNNLYPQYQKDPPKDKGNQIDMIFNKARLQFPEHSIHLNPSQAFKHYKKILMTGQNNLSTNQEEKVVELAGFWEDFDLQHLYTNTDVVGQQLLPYYQCWILTSRVFSKIKLLFDKIKWKKAFQDEAYQKIDMISQYLDKNELQFYPGKNLLTKQAARFSMGNYHVSEFNKESKNNQQASPYINQIYSIAKKNDIEIISNFFEFLAKVGIIDLSHVKSVIKNSFMESLNRIHKRQQKEMFINNYSSKRFKQLQDAYIQKDNDELARLLKGQLPNYCFYKGGLKVRKNTMDLQGLHKKFGDYQFMERVHDYIQWMFPNHYGSSFNSSSKPLNYIESELFIEDTQVKISLLYSTFMFLDFMGLSLDLRARKLSIVSQQRLKDVILVNYHNHLRIMRIFACLSVTEFRFLALMLLNFIDEHSREGQLLQRQRQEYERNWKIYGDQKQQQAKNMCFLQKIQFPKQNRFIDRFVQIISSTKQPQEQQVKPQEQQVRPQEQQAKPQEQQVKPQEQQAKPQEQQAKPQEQQVRPQEQQVKPKEQKLQESQSAQQQESRLQDKEEKEHVQENQ